MGMSFVRWFDDFFFSISDLNSGGRRTMRDLASTGLALGRTGVSQSVGHDYTNHKTSIHASTHQ